MPVPSVPVRVKTTLCSLEYEVPIEGKVLELTVPEFEKLLTSTQDIATRLTLVIEAFIRYPQLVEMILPPVKALSEIVGDEVMGYDQKEAVALKNALGQIARIYDQASDEDSFEE